MSGGSNTLSSPHRANLPVEVRHAAVSPLTTLPLSLPYSSDALCSSHFFPLSDASKPRHCRRPPSRGGQGASGDAPRDARRPCAASERMLLPLPAGVVAAGLPKEGGPNTEDSVAGLNENPRSPLVGRGGGQGCMGIAETLWVMGGGVDHLPGSVKIV